MANDVVHPVVASHPSHASVPQAAVVVPYERFVARRERRARIAAELARLDDEQTLDGEVLSVAMVATDDDRDGTT